MLKCLSVGVSEGVRESACFKSVGYELMCESPVYSNGPEMVATDLIPTSQSCMTCLVTQPQALHAGGGKPYAPASAASAASAAACTCW